MTRRILRHKLLGAIVFSVFGCLLARAAAASSPAPLDVVGLGKATVALEGNWQFHLGDNPGWASPTFDDSGWEQIGVDKPWGDQTHFGYTGYAWYRRHISFSPMPGVDSDLALLVPPIDDTYEVYWNGKLIGGLGKLPPHPVWYSSVPAPIFALGRPQTGVLAFRVWKLPYVSSDTGEAGGLNGPPVAGTAQAIADYKSRLDYRWLTRNLFSFGVDLIYVLVFVLGLLAWLRDRRQRVLLWMSLWVFSLLMAVLLNGLRLPLSVALASGLTQPILSLSDIAIWFLLLYLLELDQQPSLRRWTQVLAWISMASGSLDCLALWMDWSGRHVLVYQLSDALLTVPFTLVEAFPLVLIAFALRKRLDAARWMVAIFAALTQLSLGFRNLTGQGIRFTHWTISQLLFAPLFTIRGNAFTMTSLEVTVLLFAIVFAVYRYSVDQGERQAELEQEFKSAQELQQVLIPDALPSLPGYAVTSAYRPAQQVGGDFFQLLAQPDGSALLVLGDVSGKGLKAAMTVSLIVGTIRTAADTSDDPAEILSVLNRRLYGRLPHGFVTCVALRLNAGGECTVANAGHPAPYLNGNELHTPGSLPLGLDRSSHYETMQLRLVVGDRLTLYTDGLLEARNAAGEIFSFERLRALIATQPDAKQATEAAVAFGQDDDITVITLTRLQPGVEATTSLVTPALVPANA